MESHPDSAAESKKSDHICCKHHRRELKIKELLVDDSRIGSLIGREGRNKRFLSKLLQDSCLTFEVLPNEKSSQSQVILKFHQESEIEVGRAVKSAIKGGIIKHFDEGELDSGLTRAAKDELFHDLNDVSDRFKVDILRLKDPTTNGVVVFVRENDDTSLPLALENAIKLAGDIIHKRFHTPIQAGSRWEGGSQSDQKKMKMREAGICLQFASSGKCRNGQSCRYSHFS